MQDDVITRVENKLAEWTKLPAVNQEDMQVGGGRRQPDRQSSGSPAQPSGQSLGACVGGQPP